MKKKFALFTLVFLIIFVTACSPASKSTSQGNNQQEMQNDELEIVEDKLAKYDFNAQEIRIFTSINSSDGTISNSNYMIEGTDEITGDSVNDAVYQRNADVENLLNIKFKYTQINEDYDSIETSISKLILSGLDEYDLIINDLRSLANLSLKGMFQNIRNNDVFDLSQSYWYNDFMEDVSIGKEKSFLLAGDYFADVLRNCHALFLNKSMLEGKRPGGTDEIYRTVLDGNWTFDEFLSLTKEFLADLDSNGKYDKNDQYGFICVGTWGSAMPFMMAADTNVFTKDDNGIPILTMNNQKSLMLHEYLTELFTTNSGGNSGFLREELVLQFKNRKSLIVGYQRLSALESLRDMEDDVAVLPYPKLNSDQKKYITSSHDTTEVGAIPITSPNFDMVCVTLEALNRETKKTIIPVYYEEALKIKYTRDDTSAQIIDLIHDSMGNVFPLAYSQAVNELLGLYDVGATKNFVSGYERVADRAEKKLEQIIEEYLGS